MTIKGRVTAAVKRANSKSRRTGDWSTKPEINAQISGAKPDNLGMVLSRLVQEDKVEKRKNYEMWRVNGTGGGGTKGHAQRGISDRETETNIRDTAAAGMVAVMLDGGIPIQTGSPR